MHCRDTYIGDIGMCGIFGAIGSRIDKLDITTLNNCVDRLSHRGPDGRGIWSGEQVFLGHRRLSIVDLSNYGKQPMEYDDGRYHITYNGEIYNYIEIKRELQEIGYEFKSNCDTEVILVAYSHWGKDCVKKFNGMWSFAIYDNIRKEMFLSRDRFGIKPLFYIEEKGCFAFASEMKALMPLIDNPRINCSLIRFYQLFYHYEFEDECLIKQIKRFPPGHNAIYCNGNMKLERYWNTLDNLIEVPNTYNERVEILRNLFLDSCKIRMRSDVPIGTALSGGLDSSAVVCSMSKIARNNIDSNINKDWQHAYIAGFDGSVFDETCYAKYVTDYINIDSTVLHIENSVEEQELYRQSYLFEELWMNSQKPMMEIYRKERENNTVVSLDGHGADELFGGYTFDMKYSLLDTNSRTEQAEICHTIFDADNIESICDNFDEEKKSNIFRMKHKALVKSYYDSLYRKFIIKNKEEHSQKFHNLSNLDKELYIQTHYKVLPTILRNYDRDSMASGVEIRSPFMDYRIVSFAFSIPWQDKIHGGYSKAIVRDAMKGIIPPEISCRKSKIGFNAPISEWMRKDKEVYMDIVSSQDFINSDIIINPKKAKKQIIDAINKPIENPIEDSWRAQKAWNNINLFSWEKGFYHENGLALK